MYQIGLKKFLLLQKIKKIFHGHILLALLKMKKLLERFTKKNCGKIDQKEFRIEKVIKQKGDNLYVRWKGYDSSSNSWIDKNNIV